MGNWGSQPSPSLLPDASSTIQDTPRQQQEGSDQLLDMQITPETEPLSIPKKRRGRPPRKAVPSTDFTSASTAVATTFDGDDAAAAAAAAAAVVIVSSQVSAPPQRKTKQHVIKSPAKTPRETPSKAKQKRTVKAKQKKTVIPVSEKRPR